VTKRFTHSRYCRTRRRDDHDQPYGTQVRVREWLTIRGVVDDHRTRGGEGKRGNSSEDWGKFSTERKRGCVYMPCVHTLLRSSGSTYHVESKIRPLGKLRLTFSSLNRNLIVLSINGNTCLRLIRPYICASFCRVALVALDNFVLTRTPLLFKLDS
jgi:hypothetical protein